MDKKKSRPSSSTKSKQTKKTSAETDLSGPIGAIPMPNQGSNAGGLNEESLFNMLNQVNQMLKQNPDMVKKVSSCVNNIFENKNLMQSLVSEIEENIKVPDANDSETDDDSTGVPKIPGVNANVLSGVVDSVMSELNKSEDKEFFQQFQTLANNSD